MINSDLIGGLPTPLKNMKVNWDDDIPNIWENKRCSKPPTSDKWLFEYLDLAVSPSERLRMIFHED